MKHCTITREILHRVFSERPRVCHKGDFGYVTLLGGSLPYSGAAKLSNMAAAAVRGGAGVVRLAVPRGLCDAVLPYLVESTLCPLEESLTPDSIANNTENALRGISAIGVGMGWCGSEWEDAMLTQILRDTTCPILLDAGALNLLSVDPARLSACRGPVILTPHPMEFSRLSGVPLGEVLSDPVTHATALANKLNCIVLLKGAVTTVTDGKEVWHLDRGCAGMASGGSGDVLTGGLTAMLGYLPPPPQTAACGAYLCGVAGELAQEEYTDISMCPSDTVNALPRAIASVRK